MEYERRCPPPSSVPLCLGRIRFREHGETRDTTADVTKIKGNQVVVWTTAPLRRGDVVQLVVEHHGRELTLLSEVAAATSPRPGQPAYICLRVEGKHELLRILA